ncbi:hypothetical protein VTO58DRAFT_103949 [Aureobasidium pullulans]
MLVQRTGFKHYQEMLHFLEEFWRTDKQSWLDMAFELESRGLPLVTVARILVVGSGGIGTIAALNLHVGGACHVTMVLRSSYQKVLEDGFSIDSFDHGKLEGWKPDSILPGVPSVSTDDQAQWFDFVVCATKNLPDASPTLQIIKPAITPGHTNIVLLQNGLNIETTFLQHFPTNMILSGISYTSSHETSSGVIVQSHPDDLIIGAFAHHDNHNLSGGNETARTAPSERDGAN